MDWQDKLTSGLSLFSAEYALISGIIITLLVSAFPRNQSVNFYVSIITLLVSFFFLSSKEAVAFQGSIQFGKWYYKIACISLLGSFITLIFSYSSHQKILKSEYYFFVLNVQLAIHILAISRHYLLSFVAFELVSIAGYLLTVTYRENKHSAESAAKYFIFGAFSSGLLMYGISLLYGIQHHLWIQTPEINSQSLVAFLLIAMGIFFKISIVPMHFWTPDVYHGAPAAIGAWLSTVSKIAGFTFYFSVFSFPLPKSLQILFILLAIFSMTIGNLGAFRQNHIFRFLGFSSVSHSGFMLMALASSNPLANPAVLFYILLSIPITFLTFESIYFFVNAGKSNQIEDWAGLGKRYFLPATMLCIGVMAMIGLPPTTGFIGKLYLLMPIWQQYSSSNEIGLLLGMVFFVLNTLFSLAVYLRIPIILMLRQVQREPEGILIPLRISPILAIFTILFGVYGFDWIWNWF